MNLGGDDKFYHILLELLMYPAATSNGRGEGRRWGELNINAII